MSTIRNPVGPQPSRVYWRRRLAVLVGVLVVILIIVLIVIRPGGKPAATPSNTPTTPATAAVTACPDKDVEVDAVTDALSYPAGTDPMLSFTIQNNGTKACTFKVGTDVQKYVITSGTETIWSSTDCQSGAKPLVTTLKPGTPVQSTPFAWDRVRSSTTTCSVKNPKQVTAGGASYHLTVTVNGVTSSKANSPQFVLR
jgi:hypothetical protein